MRDGSLHRRGRTSRPLGDTFVLRTTMPTPENTGCRVPLGMLDVITDPLVLSTPGAVIERKLIAPTSVPGGFAVDWRSANITMRDCVIRLPAATMQTAAIWSRTASGVAGRVEHTTIEVPSGVRSYRHAYAFQGSGLTFHRAEIRGFVDGWSVVGLNKRGDFTAEGCYVTDMPVYTAATPGIVHPSDTVTHNDGFQIEGNLGAVSVIGCNIETALSANILVTQDAGSYDLPPVIEDNWFTIDHVPFGSMLNVKASQPPIVGMRWARNRFARDEPSKARMVASLAHLDQMDITSHGPDRNVYIGGNPADIVPVYDPIAATNRTTYGVN